MGVAEKILTKPYLHNLMARGLLAESFSDAVGVQSVVRVHG
jgi:hypothetical protein